VKSPHPFGTDLKDVGFAVSPGEILGVAGIAGNGQTELMDALSGEVLAAAPETIRLDGVAVGRLGPRERRALGGCFVPEERNGHGAVGSMTLGENAFLTAAARRALARFGFVDQAKTLDFAKEIIRRFDVRTTGPKAQARALSGGNLQKFLVGREVTQSPGALVVNQPTWGVDAGAAAAIYRALAELAENGAAVVIISQDLDEIFLICDRVAVIAGGRLSPAIPVQEATIEQIGLVMGGAAREHR
jgi:simple sugar transport system ATP-binding protein